VVAWFYRILRRAVIDLYRRRDARSRAMGRLEEELRDSPSAEEERLLCACFQRLLPAMPREHRELLQLIDLDGRDPLEVARDRGITKNNLHVRLHRARKHLRDLLERNCKACSRHGCLDCSCGEPDPCA
jgi:RNA polymerase sigma factor (sigma-70 family)